MMESGSFFFRWVYTRYTHIKLSRIGNEEKKIKIIAWNEAMRDQNKTQKHL